MHACTCVHLYAVCSTYICISIHCTSYYPVAISVSMLTNIAIVHTNSIILNSLLECLKIIYKSYVDLTTTLYRCMHKSLEWSLFSPTFWALLGCIIVPKPVHQSFFFCKCAFQTPWPYKSGSIWLLKGMKLHKQKKERFVLHEHKKTWLKLSMSLHNSTIGAGGRKKIGLGDFTEFRRVLPLIMPDGTLRQSSARMWE